MNGHDDDSSSSSHILRPQPRRPGTFSMTPLSTENLLSPSSQATSPFSANPSSPSDVRPNGMGAKTRSILNLTSSTLFGIYSPEGRENYDPQSVDASRSGLTPCGTGAQTPTRRGSGEMTRNSSFVMTADTRDLSREAERKRRRLEGEGETENSAKGEQGRSKSRPRSLSHDHRPKSLVRDTFELAVRTAALFAIGLAYGALVTQLQDKSNVVVPVKASGINTSSRYYLLFWGVTAVVLGNALPMVDQLFSTSSGSERTGEARQAGEKEDSYEMRRAAGPGGKEREPDGEGRGSLGADWNPIVRSIGAFVGVAFAIRRLPWQSTLQLSLTLALANPCIWYLIDRTRAGFVLSSIVGLFGAAAVMIVHPGVIPQPSRLHTPSSATSAAVNASSVPGRAPGTKLPQDLPMGLGSLGLTYEGIGVATWISSVLFCSAVCFGNIGRRLRRRRD